MNKDKIFASLMNCTATVTRIETTYDNKYNRPQVSTVSNNYPCMVAKKGKSYSGYVSNFGPNTGTQIDMRAFFEIDADIKQGDSIMVNGEHFIAGLIYRPMNHHIEVDMRLEKES